MNRRSFISGLVATTAGLYLPHEPQRIYSFASSKYVQVVNMTKRLIAKDMLIPEAADEQIHLAMSWKKKTLDYMSSVDLVTKYGPATLWVEPFDFSITTVLGKIQCTGHGPQVAQFLDTKYNWYFRKF